MGGRLRDFLLIGNVLVLGPPVEFLRRPAGIYVSDLAAKTSSGMAVD